LPAYGLCHGAYEGLPFFYRNKNTGDSNCFLEFIRPREGARDFYWYKFSNLEGYLAAETVSHYAGTYDDYTMSFTNWYIDGKEVTEEEVKEYELKWLNSFNENYELVTDFNYGIFGISIFGLPDMTHEEVCAMFLNFLNIYIYE
jgi:hypothetical protein